MERDNKIIEFAWCKALGCHVSRRSTVKLEGGGTMEIEQIVERGAGYSVIGKDGRGKSREVSIESVRKIIRPV